MQNLRDKLLQAGLVTQEQTSAAEQQAQAEKERARAARPERRPDDRRPDERRPGERRDDRRPDDRRPDRGPPRGRGGPSTFGGRPGSAERRGPAPAAEPRIPKLPPLALPGSKAHQRLESLKQLELDKKIRGIVQADEVPLDVGATTFYFMTRKNRLRRLELTAEQAKLLEDGTLAVVERPEPGSIEHSLVPRQTAEKLLALSTKTVRFFNKEGAPVGFMSDDELKTRQAAEAAAPPEVPEGEDERAAQAQADADSQAEADAAQAELDAHEARKAQSEQPAEG
jgi:hypothetical protein